MHIDLPASKPKDPETQAKMRKEGELKKNENFNKITNIFGGSSEQPKTGHKEGKVFEYHQKDMPDEKVDQEYEIPDNIEYSQAHLEDFMKSLKDHTKSKGLIPQNIETESVDPKEIGNSTLNPEQTDNLITTFLKNVNHNTNQVAFTCSKEKGQNVNKRSESQIISGNLDGILGGHAGATLSNSLAYSQTNASVKGYNQFNSVNLVSGVKSRIAHEESKHEEEKYSTNLHENQLPIQPYKLPDDEDRNSDEDLDREEDIDKEDFYIEVDTPVTQKSAKLDHGVSATKPDFRLDTDQMRRQMILNQDLDSNYVNPNLMDETNLFESQEAFLDPQNRETFKDYIETQMYLFHFNFNFEIDGMMLDENGDIPSFPFLEYKPTEEEVYYY